MNNALEWEKKSKNEKIRNSKRFRINQRIIGR